MSEVKYLLTGGKGLTVSVDGEVHVIHPSSPNFRLVVIALLSQEYDKVRDLIDNEKAIEAYLPKEGVEIRGDKVFWNNEEIHGMIVERIFEAMTKGLDPQPLINFLDKVQQNPSENSRKQLFTFLEAVGLTITPEGDFLAYKAIRKDWKDKHSRSIDNSVGRTVSMLREKVDDNPDRTCSHGLHVGALNYVQYHFHNGSDDRVVIVQVNPANVVSVPHDYHGQKCRCCEYTVVGEFTHEFIEMFSDEFSSEKFKEHDIDADFDLIDYDNEVDGDYDE